MRALLIDPAARKVEEVEFNGHYTHIYELLSTEKVEVDLFEMLQMPFSHAMFIDEIGRVRPEAKDTERFQIMGYPIITGRGLVLGTDGEVTVACGYDKDAFAKMITFMGTAMYAPVPPPQVIQFASMDDLLEFLIGKRQ